MTYDQLIVSTINEKYRTDALRTFISGLKKPLSDILFASQPSDLPTALALAQEVETNHERYLFATSFVNRNKNTFKTDAPFAKKNPIDSNFISKNQNPLKSYTIFQPYFNKTIANKNVPFNKTQNQPNENEIEPMDIDPSSSKFRQPTNSRNYQGYFKRQAGSDRLSGQIQFQRINHVSNDQDDCYDALSEKAVIDLEVRTDNIHFLEVNLSYHS